MDSDPDGTPVLLAKFKELLLEAFRSPQTHREFPIEPGEATVHLGGLPRVRRDIRLAERVRLRQLERVRRGERSRRRR